VAGVIDGSVLAAGDGFQLADVRCDGSHRMLSRPERTEGHGLVFVYRGAFVRHADGRAELLDSTAAYLTAPGVEERFAHPVGGDACLAMRLSPDLLATLAGGRPPRAAHAELSRRVRERLLTDPRLGVVELSNLVYCSPHHLSRVFGRVTGSSVSAYRTRIRVSRALDRLAAGETNLAALAGDLGFADHAHLTRTIRAVTGHTPTVLRAALTATGHERG